MSSSDNSGGAFLQWLPEDILKYIYAMVMASDSLQDLFNLMQTCTTANAFGKGEFVLNRVLFENMEFYDHHYHESFMRFLHRCHEAGNVQATYYISLIELLNHQRVNFDSGIEHLKEAVRRGHPVAKYIYAIYLYSAGSDQEKEEGFQVLSNMSFMELIDARKSWMYHRPSVGLILGYSNAFVRAFTRRYRQWHGPSTCNLCGSELVQELHYETVGWEHVFDEGEDLECKACKIRHQYRILCHQVVKYWM